MVDAPPTPLISLIHRCPTIRLKTLRIRWCNPAHIRAILELCPTVETLGVQVCDKPDVIMFKLSVSAAGVCIGPALDSLAFAFPGPFISPELIPALLKMVRSRWRVPAKGGPCCRLRIELLFVEQWLVLSTALVQGLQVFQGEGLQVSVLKGQEARARLLDWHI
jgi:hypothetical protein